MMRYYVTVAKVSTVNEVLDYYCGEYGWQLHSLIPQESVDYHMLVVLQKPETRLEELNRAIDRDIGQG